MMQMVVWFRFNFVHFYSKKICLTILWWSSAEEESSGKMD
jgi:hypothetical protein